MKATSKVLRQYSCRVISVFLPNGDRPTLLREPQSTGLLLTLSPPGIKHFPPGKFALVEECNVMCCC
ncbi:hypothetical protein M0802_009439 [Mischocyttarus mexicanus]|nr:hypothetical protein M0802_009439 [Mischocyttarus mexicanus]